MLCLYYFMSYFTVTSPCAPACRRTGDEVWAGCGVRGRSKGGSLLQLDVSCRLNTTEEEEVWRSRNRCCRSGASFTAVAVCGVVACSLKHSLISLKTVHKHAAGLYRTAELPCPRERHPAVFQRLRETHGSRFKKWVSCHLMANGKALVVHSCVQR